MNVQGKVVAITGGTRGFGFCLAKVFKEEGAVVAISASDEKGVLVATKELDVFGMVADVTKESDLQSFADAVVAKFGRIDIWINNAGVWLPECSATELDMSRVKKMFDINVFGLMHGSRVATNALKGTAGVILNVISTSALSGRSRITGYSASKWAANGFTKGLREELKGSSIKVFSVFPGGMKTTLFDEARPVLFDKMLDPLEVAQKVVANIKSDNPEEELVIKRPEAQ